MPKSACMIWLSKVFVHAYTLCSVSGVQDFSSVKLQMYKIQTTGNGMSDQLHA